MATTEQQQPAAILEQAGLTVEQLYDELTDGCTRPVRLEDLVYEAAERVPGLVPTRAEMDVERTRKLADKERLELAQGLLLAEILQVPRTGLHLVESMLHPTALAFEHLDELRANGSVDLGHARVTRQGSAGVLELCNPRHLNAEDGNTLAETEAAVDLVLLDPEIQIGVFRGGVVDHPRYAGERPFGAGINLTHLYHGRIDFLFYVVRDMGYVNKLFRGLAGPDAIEKLWIAAVEKFAIGGACQLPHVMDHVIAVRGVRLYLPARKEGIIPGASNLRLPRFVGDRAARQAILSGREWTAGDADADLICDEVVDQRRDRGRDRQPDRGADQLRARQRVGQPSRDAGGGGADRPVPRVHGHVLPRAGLLSPQPGARPQPRGALECRPSRPLSR